MAQCKLISALALSAVVASLLLMYARGQQPATVRPIGKTITIVAPLGLPPVPVPADNPITAETVSLGKRLYFDKTLSSDESISCATCHEPDQGFAYAQAVATGVAHRKGTRNSPTVINAAYSTAMFWDGREQSLEKQAEGPVQDPVEMAHSLSGVVAGLAADPSYVAAFTRAYGTGHITYAKVEKAIASYERTVIAGNSRFDRWYFAGEEHAISRSAKRGFEIFRRSDKGNCGSCHTLNERYALFTDNQFHNTGVGVKDGNVTDEGRYAVTHNNADHAAFKTPSLRNVAETAPYMHDGSLKTLREVVDFYARGGVQSAWRDTKMKELRLTPREKADLIAFMKSLTGDVPANALPERR